MYLYTSIPEYSVYLYVCPVCWINKLFAQRQHKWEWCEPSQLHCIGKAPIGHSITGQRGTHWKLVIRHWYLCQLTRQNLTSGMPAVTLHFRVYELGKPWWCEWVGREEGVRKGLATWKCWSTTWHWLASGNCIQTRLMRQIRKSEWVGGVEGRNKV